MPSGAAQISAKRPSPWWSSQTVAKERFSRMKKVGAPCESRSLVCGRPRQISRTAASIRSSMPGLCRAVEHGEEHPRQLGREPRLADVVVRAGLTDLEHALLVVVRADRDDRKPGPALAQLARRLDAVEHGHLDVHHDRV